MKKILFSTILTLAAAGTMTLTTSCEDQLDIERLKNVGSDCPHLFDKLFRAPKADDRKVTWEHGTEANSRFYTVSTSAAKDAGFNVGFKKGKHEFFPYPQTVMDKNPNLEQNPGW